MNVLHLLWFRPLKGFGKILVLEKEIVAFVMEHEHFTYPEAIRYLARKYNIEIEETEQTNEKQIQIFERVYLVSEFAKTIFIKHF
jgi:DNA primase